MKKVVKYSGFAVLGIAIILLVLIKFSAVETNFKCSGEITKNNISQGQSIVYIKLTEYRPWVGLWSNSDGSIDLEIPNGWFDYFEQIEKNGDHYLIYKAYPEKTFQGIFSLLSKTIAINTPQGVFEGSCSSN
ncbi:hypothetical protein KBB92_03150 [Candidatus Shapirobacteria bacterium]|jgi:hypothetical protein|nr:hypothetical protein [Candidatus Shapirobacteria bacterium]